MKEISLKYNKAFKKYVANNIEQYIFRKKEKLKRLTAVSIITF